MRRIPDGHPLADAETEALQLLGEALAPFGLTAEAHDCNSDDYEDADADGSVNYFYGLLDGLRTAASVGL